MSKIIRISDTGYPAMLKTIYQAPPRLYIKGNLIIGLNETNAPAIAIVGSRRATSYGLNAAYSIAQELSESGITVVSGLAEGVDAAAHRGALEGRGKTIAVLGCGVDVVYPWINRGLYGKIKKEGSLISELPDGTPPRGKQFPSRNRIISGLCAGVLVVEGAERSGTLITADMALEQGREVFALPGPVTSRYSTTPNKLLKAGASLVESAKDIIDCLGLKPHFRICANMEEGANPGIEDLNREEKSVMCAVGHTPKLFTQIVDETGLQCEKVSSILVMLEIKRIVDRNLDGQYVLVV